MLIHLIPQIYTPYAVPVRLIDVAIPELGLVLDGHKDLAIRRPFPNKRYWVACRKVGQKAIAGFLVESKAFVPAYTVTTRWAVNADTVLTHSVAHVVLDKDFDARAKPFLGPFVILVCMLGAEDFLPQLFVLAEFGKQGLCRSCGSSQVRAVPGLKGHDFPDGLEFEHGGVEHALLRFRCHFDFLGQLRDCRIQALVRGFFILKQLLFLAHHLCQMRFFVVHPAQGIQDDRLANAVSRFQ